MRFLLLLLLLFVGLKGHAGGAEYHHLNLYLTPPGFLEEYEFHPVGYLESYPVADPLKKLKGQEKENLRVLFINAAKACKEKYHQDYPLSTYVPIYKLLAANFPSVRGAEGEGGNVAFLGQIAVYLGAVAK